MANIEQIVDKVWQAMNKYDKTVQAAAQTQGQEVAAKKETAQKAPAPKPVQTVKPVDNRTTAQKVADSQAAYDSYMGSEEKKQNQQAANRKAMQETFLRLFAVPGTTMGEMPLSVASPVPVDRKEQELKATADYYKGQQQAEEDRAVMDADLKEYESWSDEDKTALEFYAAHRPGGYTSIVQSIGAATAGPGLAANINSENAAKAAQAYQALVERHGEEKVKNLAESLERFNNEKMTQDVAQYGAESVAGKTGAAIGHSAATVAANLGDSLAGPIGFLSQLGTRTGRYATLDPNNLGHVLDTYSGAVRGQVVRDIEGEDGNWLRKIAAIGYEGLMSAADSAARMAAGGFDPGVSAAIAASGSFSNSLRQYSAQGASPEQAAAAALVTSGIEYLTEKIPMDELLKVGKSGSAVNDVLKQAFITEPTTEEISLFGNVLAEAAILGQKSDRSQRIGELIAGGASYQEAKEQVNRELLNEAARTYAVSAFSGGLSAGGAAIVNGSQNQPMSMQAAMDSVVASYMPNIPKDQPVQQTEQQRAMQRLTDEVMGVKPEMQEGTTDINKKSGSIATPEPVQADSFTSKTTGGTAPIATAPSLSGDAEASRFTSDNATKIDTVLNDSITEPGAEVKGTGAAEQNFSGKAEYQDLLYEGNVQPDRAGDVRPMEVPKTDTAGNPVSEVAANVYGSQYTPDDLASETESAIQRGELSYITITNDEAAERATQKIEAAGGWREAYTQWHDEVRDGKTSAEMAARGAMLLNHAAEVYEQTKATGDEAATKAAKQEWLSVLLDVREMGTNTAQGLQAMRMIRELAPPDKMDFAVASIRRMVADMKLQGDVKIDENLLNEYRMAETDEQRDEIMTEIQQNVADQIPSTFLDKWTALRYMNMLGNLKTNVRNVAGNVGSMVMYRIKDQVATAVERLAGTERTKSSIVGRELLQACKDDFDQVKSTVNSGGKYNERMASSDEFRQGVMDKRQIFKNPVAEGYRKATNWMMNNEYFGDEAFGRAAYARALAGYLKAKGYDAAAVQNGSIDDKVMNEARAYAIREAQEATFHDNSKLAEIATRMQRATGVVGQGIMPFTKTPANVLTRAMEFSPLGLIDTAIKQAQRAAGNTGLADKTGAAGEWARAGQDITGADIANSLAKSVTGSVLVGLGYLLKDQGWLTGGPDEDEEKAEFDKLTGKQNWALTRPGGTSYTMDWLTPAAMPMFMGAQLYDVLNADKDFTFSDLSEVFTSIADPMVQMSMLQGLNDTLDGIKYADNNLGQFFINAAVSYLTQGLTNTLLGQLERSTEENRQTTYIDKDSWVPTRIQQALGKASQKIPIWDYQQMDYRNAWGETEENEGGLLYNLLSPGYLSKERQTAVTEELYRLREATGMNVFPQPVEKQLTYTDTNGTKHIDHNLTQEELEKMQTTEGQTAAKLFDRMIDSPDFKALSDQQKAYAIEAVYQYAQEQGKKAALSDYHSEADSWIAEVTDGDISTFINRGASGPLRTAVNNAVAALANGWEVTGADKKAMNESYSGYSKLGDEARQRIQEQLDSDVKKFVEIRAAGVDTESYIKAVEGVKQLKPEEGKNKVSETQKREAIADSGLPDKTIDALMKAYMTDYDPEDDSPDKTELRYDYARQELGLSPAKYAAAYRVQAEGGKKAEKIAAWMEQGYTKQEATILYNLFTATGKSKIDVETWHNSKTK